MSATIPVRLRLSRAKGFDLQRHSRDTNGLPAINCARPGPWGNPFIVGATLHCGIPFSDGPLSRARAIEWHQGMWLSILDNAPGALDVLRNHNLACWCCPREACHADT